MRRKKRPSHGSLDSLLDTMTNVVGILVILLAVTQLGVHDAVQRIRGDVAVVTAEQSRRSKADSENAKREAKTTAVKWKDLQVNSADVQSKLDQQLSKTKEVNLNLTALKKSPVKLDEVRKLRDEKMKKKEALIKTLAQQVKKLIELKARLSKTPKQGPPPDARIVRLPNPRAAPKGATAVEYVCRHGRVCRLSLDSLRRIAQDRVKKAGQSLVKPDGIDCKKLKAIFENEDIGNAYYRMKIKIIGGGRLPDLVVNHREEGGNSVDEVRNSKSVYRQSLRDINRNKQYIRFLVYPDSFESYLAARDVATGMKIQAGWVARDPNFERRISLGLPSGIVCSGYKPPPKPKTKPKPRPKPRPRKNVPRGKPTKPAPPPRPPVANDDID